MTRTAVGNPTAPPAVHRRYADAAITLGVFVSVFLVRWLTFTDLSGDDHWSLWNAATFLKGDRPFHQFVDPGDPLYWGLSALAQLAVGYRAIGEILLGMILISVAVTLSFRMIWKSTRLLSLALTLTALVSLLITVTKLYSYPKIFVYPIGIWLGWRYIDRPSLRRACALAAAVAIAFGYRHDHGAYVAIGAAASVAAAHWTAGLRTVAWNVARVGLITIAILSPYFALIQANEGLVPYFRERMAFAARVDAAGRRAVPFVIDHDAPLLATVDPLLPVPVGVRWSPDTTPAQRTRIEQARRLEPRPVQTSGWRHYIVEDLSQANLDAMTSDPRVASFDGIVGSFRRGFVLPPFAGGRISVQWAAWTTPAVRSRLEQAYHLEQPVVDAGDHTGRTLSYVAGDPSTATLTALGNDENIGAVPSLQFVRVPVVVRLRETKPARVALLWDTTVTDADRRSLEERYRLRYDPLVDDGMAAYALGDASAANIRALVDDPHVRDTNGLDRAAAEPYRDSWLTALSRSVPVLRLRPLPRLFHAANAGVWMYYVSMLLPFAVVLTLLVDWWRGIDAHVMPYEAQKMVAVAILMGVANFALLRKLGYFPDHADAAVIMGGWLLGRAWRARPQTATPPRRRIRLGALAAGIVVAISVFATGSYVHAGDFFDRYALNGGVRAVWDQNVHKFDTFSISPPIDSYAPQDATGDRAVIRYLRECTRPTDRIWVTSDVYTIPYYTERRVVGHIFWANGFMASPAYQQHILDLVDHEEVPLIFGVGGNSPLENFASYDLVRRYVAERYRQHYAILQDQLGGKVLWLLADSRRTPTGTYPLLGLPCFK